MRLITISYLKYQQKSTYTLQLVYKSIGEIQEV